MSKDDENMLATLKLVYKQLGKDNCVHLLTLLTDPSSSDSIKIVKNIDIKGLQKNHFFPLVPNACFLKILEFLPLWCCLYISKISGPFSDAVTILLQKRKYLRNCAMSGFENRSLSWPKVMGAGDWSRCTIERCMKRRSEVLNQHCDVKLGVRITHLKKENKPVPYALHQLYKISKDIGRTLPRSLKTPGMLRILSRILGTYALSDPAIGYCQGLNFVVGVLLISIMPQIKTSRLQTEVSCKETDEQRSTKVGDVDWVGESKQSNFSVTLTEKEEKIVQRQKKMQCADMKSEFVPEISKEEDSEKPTQLEYRVFALVDQLMRYNNIPSVEGLYRTLASDGKPVGWSGDGAGGLHSKYGTLGYGLRYYFLPSLPRATIAFVHLDKLMEHFLPDLHAHFIKLHISPELFCAEWYFTLFSYVLPLPLTQRVWDVFFIDGTKALHRFALVLLARLKPLILFKDFETTMGVLKSAKSNSDVKQLFFNKSDEKPGDGFIAQSFKYKVTNRSLFNLSSKLLNIVQANSRKVDKVKNTNIVRCRWRFILNGRRVSEANARVLKQKTDERRKKPRSASYLL